MHVKQILASHSMQGAANVCFAVSAQVNTSDVHEWLAFETTSKAIARASTGRIWIVYAGTGAGGVSDTIYAAYSDDYGSTWTEEVVVAAARAEPTEGFLLLLDSSDVPHILYNYDPAAGNSEVRYSNRVGGVWSAPETVHTALGTFRRVDACMDTSDRIHVVWEDGGDVEYLVGISGAWGIMETVDNIDSTREPKIAVSSADEPFVVFNCITAGPNFGLYMRYRTAGVWQARESISALSTGKPNIAIDSGDNIHVAWIQYTVADGEVLYRERIGGAWQVAVTIDTPDLGEDFAAPLLSLDTSDDVYIVFQHDRGAADEVIYYRKITAGALGARTIFVNYLTRPNDYPSTYAVLWQNYNADSVLSSACNPAVALLDEVLAGFTARLFFVRI